MTRPILFGYQLLTGLSDACTGAMLIIAPELTLRLVGMQVPTDALPFLSFIGAFVLSVGLICLYGALLIRRSGCVSKLEVVWLVTAITRASVAVFVLSQVTGGALESSWLTVAVFDGACATFQAVGLRKGWLTNAAR